MAETRRILYFIPRNGQGISAGELATAGLADRFDIDGGEPKTEDAGKFVAVPIQSGPSGVPGFLVALPPKAGLVYHAERQTWHGPYYPQGEHGESFWLGWETAARPRPADLARARLYRGVDVPLGDPAEAWHVPVARLAPVKRVLADGRWTTRRDPAADGLFDLAARLRPTWNNVQAAFAAFEEAGARADELSEQVRKKQPVDDAALRQAVSAADQTFNAWKAALELLDPNDTAAVLATNYRVGAAEISALGLLACDPATGMSSDWMVLDALVDGAGLRASAGDAEKKTP